MFNHDKLAGLIKEKRTTQKALAKLIGISDNSFSSKMNNKSEFSTIEIAKICNALDIDNSAIGLYFFSWKVWKVKQINKQKTEKCVILFSLCLNLFTQSFLQVFTTHYHTVRFYKKCCHFCSFSSANAYTLTTYKEYVVQWSIFTSAVSCVFCRTSLCQ